MCLILLLLLNLLIIYYSIDILRIIIKTVIATYRYLINTAILLCLDENIKFEWRKMGRLNTVHI